MEPVITIGLLVVIIAQQVIHTYENRQKDRDFRETIDTQSRLIKAETLEDFIITSPATEEETEEEPSDFIDPEDLTPELLSTE